MRSLTIGAVFVVAVLMLPTAACQAELLASESFATTAGVNGYAVGSIGYQDPTIGSTGFIDAWNGGTAAFVAVDGGLTHDLTPGDSLDGQLISYTSPGYAPRRLSRPIDYTPTDGTYYMSTLFQANYASTTDFGIGLGPLGSVAWPNQAPETYIAIRNNTFRLHVPAFFGDVDFFDWVTFGETYFVLLKIDYSTTGDDLVSFKIFDGSSNEVYTVGIGAIRADYQESDIARLFVGTWDFSSAVVVDEWRFGTELSDVMVQAGLVGDYSNNGFVDAADYTVWRDTLGQIGPALAADGNRDNQIDADDYAIWRTNFGATSGAAAAGAAPQTAIPEPATGWLLLVGIVVAPWLKRSACRIPSTR